MYTHMSAEIRRAFADIDRDVVNLSRGHADQLALCLWLLKVQPAQHALAGDRVVDLPDVQIEPSLTIVRRVPLLGKKAALIGKGLGLDDENAVKLGRPGLNHGSPGIGLAKPLIRGGMPYGPTCRRRAAARSAW